MDYKHNIVLNCDNEVLELNSKVDIKLIDIQGIEGTSYTINSVVSEQDGQTVSSVKVEPRELTIFGDIEKNENELINRDKLIRFFKPKCVGTMYVTRNSISRKIEYRVLSGPLFQTNKMFDYNAFTVSLESTEEPYFSDVKNSGNYLTAISNQFAFPLVIRPPQKGKVMGYKTYRPFMPLVNDGDKEVGLEIIAIAKRGKVDNLKLILNNNEYIKFNDTLNQGDELKINTNPRKKSIVLNGINAINKIDRNSTFFSIEKGKSILRYECDNGSSNIDINVLFYRKFLGI